MKLCIDSSVTKLQIEISTEPVITNAKLCSDENNTFETLETMSKKRLKLEALRINAIESEKQGRSKKPLTSIFLNILCTLFVSMDVKYVLNCIYNGLKMS